MSWQPSAHFLQIFSCVNVTSVSALSYPAWSYKLYFKQFQLHFWAPKLVMLCCYFLHFTIIYILNVLFFGQFYNQSLLLSTFWLQPNNIYSAELSPWVPTIYLKAFLFEFPFVYLFSVLYSWLILYYYINLALNHWGALHKVISYLLSLSIVLLPS